MCRKLCVCMKKNLQKDLLFNFIFSLVILGAAGMVNYLFPMFMTPYWYWQVVFFFIITGLMVWTSHKIKTKETVGFANVFIIMTAAKLILAITLISIFTYINPTKAARFALTFVAFYLAYLCFEVYMLLKINKTINS